MTDSVENKPEGETGRPELGRNEPCPCGSGKKYKRCHGVSAAPLLSTPKSMAEGGALGAGGMPAMPPGMENMNPEMMAQVASMLQRLPRGQLQKLQSIMQRAMSGKDVSREAEEFQKTLPPDFQQMLMSMAPAMAMAQAQTQGQPQAAAPQASSGEMTEEEARKIVAQAAAAGKISSTDADTLLKSESESKPGIGKLWRGLGKKK
ncbi:MAG: SEC-C metal-binding domain-containing protein [Oligoflexia bacterium]|nr:SEC-C metal-binding domain-containing protein [Oligoflexia bacterium]